MSNPASFWAAKSGGVKSATPPAETFVKPVAAPELSKKAGTILKGRSTISRLSNRTSQTIGPKKEIKAVNWADSDDDEDFLASFTSSRRVKEPAKTVAATNTHITDLTTAVQDKNFRITELQEIVNEQQQRLAELQSNADTFATQIEHAKRENLKRLLHVQKLVAEVDEKDRRVAILVTEVDERCAQIAQLDSGDSSTQVSSQDTLSVFIQRTPTDESGTRDTTAEDEASVKGVNTTNGVAEKVPSPTTAVLVGPFAPRVAAEQIDPAINQSVFPIFATPSTIKQVALPPPAPKLKMPVDLSKFAKKPATAKVTSQTKAKVTAKDPKKDSSAPKINPSTDIRTKRREERVLFGNGPQVQVKMGHAILATVPKYVLMQCSSKAWKHFTDDPDAISFTLPAGSMDATAASAHLEWMREMMYQSRVYSITLHADEKFDDKNLNICRAARVLGLNNKYVGHFTKVFCDRIRSNNASHEFMNKVAALAYPGSDPIFDCLVNNLANLRIRNAAKNAAELEAFLQKHTGLKAQVGKIEERICKKQDSAKLLKELKGAKPIQGEVVHIGKTI